MKTCKACGESKPLDEYHRDKDKKDGRRTECKGCTRRKNRKYYESHKERVLSQNRTYRESNAESIRQQRRGYYEANRESRAEYDRSYYEANRQTILARNREYWNENRADILSRKREYWNENRERFAESRANNPHWGWESYYRRAAERCGVTPTVESFTRDELIARRGPNCWHCGGTFEELDHWPLPISRGGAHSLDNCVPSCRDCNQRSWRTESV